MQAADTFTFGREILGIPAGQLLGLSVLGAVVTTIGSLMGVLIKDVWAAHWFEERKARRSITDIYRRYQIPIFLAARELSGRCRSLTQTDEGGAPNPEFNMTLECLSTPLGRPRNSAEDPHYLRYRFASNVYRLCSYLGWVELYRRDLGAMDVDALGISHRLDRALDAAQNALADGLINDRDDWEEWRDCLIFREELRAIGNRMIVDNRDGNRLTIIDFGSFVQILEHDQTGTEGARWFIEAARFFEQLSEAKDFRLVRMRLLLVRLTELMELLQPRRNEPDYRKTAREYRAKLDELTGGNVWRKFESPSVAALTKN